MKHKSPNFNKAYHKGKKATLNIYWLAYPYPFVPIPDLTPAFDELGKAVKNWFKKREYRKTNKKKIDETI